MKIQGIASGKTFNAALAILLVGGILMTVSACGTADNTDTGTSSSSTSASGDTLVFAGGKYIQRTVHKAGTLTFKVTGIGSDASDQRSIAYFYDEKGFAAGKDLGLGFNGDLRTEKLKCYDANGDLMGYESTRYGTADDWDSGTTYDVTLEFGDDFVRAEVSGIGSVQKDGPVKYPFTLGFCDSVGYWNRGVIDGAVVTDIVWPDGADNEEKNL